MTFPLDQFGFVRFPVTLDGKELTVELTTGASDTIFDLETAENLFGFEAGDPRLSKLGPTAHGDSYGFPFKTIGFGNVQVSDPQIVLMNSQDSRLGPDFQGLIGLSLLRKLHLYVSYHRHKLFVTAADAH